MKISINHKGGFTLIEVLIYSALLAIFLGGSIALLNDILSSSGKVSDKTEILFSQEFIDKKLEWIISSSKIVQEPAANSSSSVLRLILDDAASTPISISQGTSTLEISWGGGSPVELNNSRVKITDFSVSHIVIPNMPSQLRVNFNSSGLIGSRVASSSFLYVIQR